MQVHSGLWLKSFVVLSFTWSSLKNKFSRKYKYLYKYKYRNVFTTCVVRGNDIWLDGGRRLQVETSGSVLTSYVTQSPVLSLTSTFSLSFSLSTDRTSVQRAGKVISMSSACTPLRQPHPAARVKCCWGELTVEALWKDTLYPQCTLIRTILHIEWVREGKTVANQGCLWIIINQSWWNGIWWANQSRVCGRDPITCRSFLNSFVMEWK